MKFYVSDILLYILATLPGNISLANILEETLGT